MRKTLLENPGDFIVGALGSKLEPLFGESFKEVCSNVDANNDIVKSYLVEYRKRYGEFMELKLKGPSNMDLGKLLNSMLNNIKTVSEVTVQVLDNPLQEVFASLDLEKEKNEKSEKDGDEDVIPGEKNDVLGDDVHVQKQRSFSNNELAGGVAGRASSINNDEVSSEIESLSQEKNELKTLLMEKAKEVETLKVSQVKKAPKSHHWNIIFNILAKGVTCHLCAKKDWVNCVNCSKCGMVICGGCEKTSDVGCI